MSIASLRKRQRGQSLVIIALSATVLFGIIALGLDAGRLYFQRRDAQNAADSGALAGAQDLIPQGPTIGGTPWLARCNAVKYALAQYGDVPQHDCTAANLPFWSSSATITEFAQGDSAPIVRVTTPSRNAANELESEVFYTVPTTFASILGFRSSQVYAVAYARGGFFNKAYTIFGFDAAGSGNSVNYDQNGNGQIDNGNNGTDCDKGNPNQGKLVSNAKFHAPNPNGGDLNLNGQFYYAQASDTHALIVYWQDPVSPTTSNIDPAPNYDPPAKAGTVDPATYIASGLVHYRPGIYDYTITITSGTTIFDNGVYYFTAGGLNITGGNVANTSTGLPMYNKKGWGISDLPAAADGTNGIEFVFDGSSSFSATGSGSVFFVAPSFVPQATDEIAFFIKGPTATGSGDTISGPSGITWNEAMSAGSEFEVWGTIFNQDTNGSHGTVVTLTAVSTSKYAVTGSVISPQVDIDGGGLVPNGGIKSSSCPPPGGYRQNPAGYLVQYNPNFAPHFRGYSYLVK